MGLGMGLIFQNFDGTGMGLGLKIFRILITTSELQNKNFSCYRNSLMLRENNFDFIKIKLIIFLEVNYEFS
jgi:hypothetical protein